MSNLESMAAQVQGQHNALMHAQGLPKYETLRAQNAELVALIRDALDDHDIDILGSDWTDRAESIIARGQA